MEKIYKNFEVIRKLKNTYSQTLTTSFLAENEEEARKIAESGLKESRNISTRRDYDGEDRGTLLHVTEIIEVKEIK